MRYFNGCSLSRVLVLLPLVLAGAGCQWLETGEKGFVSIFDGRSLKGWALLNPKGDGYGVTNVVKNGVSTPAIFCAAGGGGNLLTEKAYGDFVLRFDFRLKEGSNNGLAIRAPMQAGSLAYEGMELQILDGAGWEKKNGKTLKPEQYHGSLYNVAAARRGVLKPAGEWNRQEVVVLGRHVRVVLNGREILNVDINSITDPAKLRKHPGLLRDRGHIGFLGHNDYVEFANIRIREIARPVVNNIATDGFRPLFNGRDLAGWQGLMKQPNDNPYKRADLASNERTTAQAEADANMTAHWRVEGGALAFDGKGRSLQTVRDYKDYELLVDWKIKEAGDSGIYLRGTPQVQIWDPRASERNAVGSGGLFNNKQNRSTPLRVADHLTGSWNHFRILMVQDRVHVFLNNQLVVKDTVLENFWDRAQPLLRSGPIELQNHGNNLWFRNIYIREISIPDPAAPAETQKENP